jgi:hypothetical protein
VYGATAPTYEAVTGRRGSFRAFSRGLAAAREADLNLQLNVILVKDNAHEVDAMTAIADRLGVPHTVYTNISRRSTADPNHCRPSRRRTCASGRYSRDATPGTRSSTPTRTGRSRSARSAGTSRSAWSTRAPLGWPGWVRSPTPCCCAPAAARDANCRAPARSVGRWPSGTSRLGRPCTPIASMARKEGGKPCHRSPVEIQPPPVRGGGHATRRQRGHRVRPSRTSL